MFYSLSSDEICVQFTNLCWSFFSYAILSEFELSADRMQSQNVFCPLKYDVRFSLLTRTIVRSALWKARCPFHKAALSPPQSPVHSVRPALSPDWPSTCALYCSASDRNLLPALRRTCCFSMNINDAGRHWETPAVGPGSMEGKPYSFKTTAGAFFYDCGL